MFRAIFPLPVFLLPGGYTKLRIFEPRYLSMVGEALKCDHGFVICKPSDDTQFNITSEGVYVRIVDFSQDQNGQLLVDVHAQHRVHIKSPFQDKQSLTYANISEFSEPLWKHSDDTASHFTSEMGEMLSNVFYQHPQIDALYQEKHFEDPVWVASRWLELLPLKNSEKHKLQASVNFEQVVRFLHTVLYKSQ